MLSQLTAGTNTYIYRYDGLGNRVAKIVNSVETRYVGGLAETDASGNITSYFVYGFGLISKITPSNESYHYHFDGLGSTIAITDSSGTIVNKYSYDEFGKVLNQEEAISNPFKYVGQFGVMDEGNGLLYMRARYYDFEEGRFISKDPIGFAGGLNLYVYVGNNPVIGVDPSGLYSSVGRLTLSKANKHWREGCGAPLFVDINTLDLSYVTKLPPSGQVNFAGKNFSSINDALVYGTVTLFPGPNNTVSGGYDYYNFDLKPWSAGTFVRNIETIQGGMYAGPGTPYQIIFTGSAPLGEGNVFEPEGFSGGW